MFHVNLIPEARFMQREPSAYEMCATVALEHIEECERELAQAVGAYKNFWARQRVFWKRMYRFSQQEA